PMEDFPLMSIVTTFSALASSSQARMRGRRASESCVDTSSAGGVLLRAPSSAVGILCWLSFRHPNRSGAPAARRWRNLALRRFAYKIIALCPRSYQGRPQAYLSAAAGRALAGSASDLRQGRSAAACAFLATPSGRRRALRSAVEDTCDSGPVRKVQAGGGWLARPAASLSGSRAEAKARAALDASAFRRHPGRSITAIGTVVK